MKLKNRWQKFVLQKKYNYLIERLNFFYDRLLTHEKIVEQTKNELNKATTGLMRLENEIFKIEGWCKVKPCPHGHVDWDDCPDCRH